MTMANTSARRVPLIRRLRNQRKWPSFPMAVSAVVVGGLAIGATAWPYLTDSEFAVSNSAFLMTVFDAFVLSTVFCAYGVVCKHYRAVKDLGFTYCAVLVLIGLTTMALFCLGDLFIMHVLSLLISQGDAMAIMTELHLNWSWPIFTIVAGSVMLGLACSCQRVIPNVSSDMNRLELGSNKLKGELSKLRCSATTLRDRHETLEQQVEERTAELMATNTVLQHEVVERKVAEEALRKAHDEMEKGIEERTTELAEANMRLQREIANRERAEQILFEEKERAQVTLNSIADAVIATDAEGNVQYINPVAEELTGWPVGEAQGQPLSTVFHVVDEQKREPVANLLARCLEEGVAFRLLKHCVLLSRGGPEYGIQDSAAPIYDREGGVVGVVLVFSDVTEARHTSQQLSHQASHDALTGLVNRFEFEQRLQRVVETAQAEHTVHAMCYLDLDQFKVINDNYGHMAGDQLLRQVGSLLQEQVRKRDTLARLGGDEFGCLMERCSLKQALRVASGLRRAVEKLLFVWESKSIRIGVSIGVVAITDASKGIDGVLSAADNACYVAKDQGRNRIHVCREQDTGLTQPGGEMQWVGRINHAIERDRFRLSYQPILPLNSIDNQLQCYELLLRMEDEEGRSVPPGAFLPAAERYNLATTVDYWVVGKAFDWLACHPEHVAGLGMCSINLSGHSIGDSQFLTFVVQQLSEKNIPTEKICFEITETAAVANLTKAIEFIRTLNRSGCRFALDDFGGGLSSFGYLKHLPADYVKIDGMFVKDITAHSVDFAMVSSINDIAQAMGKQTIAECVENESTLSLLREVGVDFAQGYYLGQPQSIERMM